MTKHDVMFTYLNQKEIYVRVGLFERNGTTSVPKSVLRYVVDKVKLFVPI